MRIFASAVRITAAILTWLALAIGTVVVLRPAAVTDPPIRSVQLIGALWVLFGLAAWRLLRTPIRAAVPILLVGGVVLQVLAVSVPPRMTDDFTRYAWDGRVQAAGISPYQYPPTAAELAPLRTDWLFPADWPAIDGPDQPSFYPPGAQLYFVTTSSLSRSTAEHTPWQIGAGLLAVATMFGLVVVLRRSRRDPRLAVFWAWCPTVVLEAGNNAHVDVLAALLVVAGLGVLAARAGLTTGLARIGGALLGAAVAVKMLPLVVLAALSPYRIRSVLIAAGAALGFLYLPHFLFAGSAVVDNVGRFLTGEAYGGGGTPTLLPLALPSWVAPYIAAAVLVAVAVVVWRYPDASRPWRGPLVMTGATLLVLGPSYPWYALLLVALVALDGRWEWLAVAAAGYAAYHADAIGLTQVSVQAIGYGAALGLVLVATLVRRMAQGQAAVRIEEVQPIRVYRQ